MVQKNAANNWLQKNQQSLSNIYFKANLLWSVLAHYPPCSSGTAGCSKSSTPSNVTLYNSNSPDCVSRLTFRLNPRHREDGQRTGGRNMEPTGFINSLWLNGTSWILMRCSHRPPPRRQEILKALQQQGLGWRRYCILHARTQKFMLKGFCEKAAQVVLHKIH